MEDKDKSIPSEEEITVIRYNPNKMEYPSKANFILISIIVIIIICLFTFLFPSLYSDNNLEKNLSNINKPIIIEPKEKKYTHCIIFLPGLGTSPKYFLSMLTEKFNINKKNTTKIIILDPPKMKLSNGRYMRSWFDITLPVDSNKNYNFEDAKKSSNFLKTIIEKEAKLLNNNYKKIFIGGHSQGAFISLLTAYTINYDLGGVLAFCGGLFPETKILKNKEKLNVFICNGYNDPLVPFKFHSKSIKKIEKYEGVEKHYYEHSGHSIEDEAIEDLCKYLNRVMI